ncbi:DUF1622 domain-containing protein [Subdoligranulum sp. DSM 109015]|uniref:DUF1622 domain-containing protein n=1 Tax=Gemmiger gallinarum TaxID=2779354 RepID=A0ABR9R4R4_9FIRM|nr:DUF1622 domain-containing protein [Gemmiger gallinarum]
MTACGAVIWEDAAVEAFDLFMQNLLDILVSNAIHLFELVGVVVLIVAGVQGVVNYIRHDPMVRLKLAKGMALCLEFKLGSEILRTVVVRDLSEIAIVGAIIVLRAALTFLLHWEIKNEEAEAEATLNKEYREIRAQQNARKEASEPKEGGTL